MPTVGEAEDQSGQLSRSGYMEDPRYILCCGLGDPEPLWSDDLGVPRLLMPKEAEEGEALSLHCPDLVKPQPQQNRTLCGQI